MRRPDDILPIQVVVAESATDEVWLAMQASGASFHLQRRAAEKQRSRRLDTRAISNGDKSVAQLKGENEVIASLAVDACIELAASRSLG